MRKLFWPLSMLAAGAFGSTPPDVGTKAPHFVAAATTGQIKLGDLIGRHHIVLYFYPKDFTGG